MIRELLRFSPLSEGSQAPALSLTADEGTWIKLRDFEGHLNVVFYFFKDGEIPETAKLLRDLNANRAQFEELETAIFGVCAKRAEQLRSLRDALGLDFFLIYDPLAVTARSFGASGRIRPYCKDTVFLISKDQKVAFSMRGRPTVDQVLSAAAKLQGVVSPEADTAQEADAADAPTTQSKSAVRDPGQGPNRVIEIDPEAAEKMLAEEDSLFVLVDVRTISEYESDHSPLAIHMPVDEVTHRYHEFGQTDFLIFICQSGGRSAQAAEFMCSIGSTEIYSVNGGMSSWEGDRESGAVGG
jgi:rhodanese-related sulfurtransferase/peroxiredoxin